MLDERYRRVWSEESLPRLEAFDPRDDAQLEAAAEHLLARFREEHDAEAFALLMELTRGRLLSIARRMLARLARSERPEALVEGVMARLFTGRCRALPLACSFLVLARGLMHQQALADAAGAADAAHLPAVTG